MPVSSTRSRRSPRPLLPAMTSPSRALARHRTSPSSRELLKISKHAIASVATSSALIGCRVASRILRPFTTVESKEVGSQRMASRPRNFPSPSSLPTIAVATEVLVAIHAARRTKQWSYLGSRARSLTTKISGAVVSLQISYAAKGKTEARESLQRVPKQSRTVSRCCIVVDVQLAQPSTIWM